MLTISSSRDPVGLASELISVTAFQGIARIGLSITRSGFSTRALGTAWADGDVIASTNPIILCSTETFTILVTQIFRTADAR